MRKLAYSLLFALALMAFSSCHDINKIYSTASDALEHRNYKQALETILELNDGAIERNDSLYLLLSEAYYGVNSSYKIITADAICDLDITPDGKWILFTDLRNGRVAVYSFPDLKFNRFINLEAPVFGIDFSPNASEFAAALANSEVVIYDFASGLPVKSLKGHTSRARAVAYLDSTHLLSGSNDQSVIDWDLQQREILDRQWRHRKNIKSIKKGKVGDYVVSTSNDGTAFVWDFTDKSKGEEHLKVVHGSNYVNDGALSPDNKTLVTVSGDGDAKIWDVETGVLRQSVPLLDAGSSVEFSPDGKYLAVGGYAFVHVINMENLTEEAKYPISNDAVWGLKFVGDNKVVFTDSSHFYEFSILSKKALIEGARQWLKDNKTKK